MQQMSKLSIQIIRKYTIMSNISTKKGMLCAFLVDLCLLKFTEKICKERRAGTLRKIMAVGAASAKRTQFTRGRAAQGEGAYRAEAPGAHGADVIYALAARVCRTARRSDERIKFVPPRKLRGGT